MSEAEIETGDAPEEPAEAPDASEEIEDEPDEEDEPLPADPTPEQLEKAQKAADKQVQKRRDQLDGEAMRHRKRLAEILQEDILSLVPCELCRADLAGWVETLVAIPDEVKQRVRIQIGDREPENWQADRYSRRCDTCDGLGEVTTGGRVHGQLTLPCIDCQGRGWIAVGPERTTGRPAQLVAVPPQNGPPEATVADPVLEAEAAALRAKGYVVIKTGG